MRSFSKTPRTEILAERKLIAQLSAGSPGAALALDLERSVRLRKSVLGLLDRATAGEKYAGVFAATAQLAKQENESFENVLHVLYSLLTDLLEFSHSPKSRVPRNPDLHAEIEALGKKVNGEWIFRATRGLDTLESRLRRNIGRQLGLDALMVSLALR